MKFPYFRQVISIVSYSESHTLHYENFDNIYKYF